jgi:hypothetical protein
MLQNDKLPNFDATGNCHHGIITFELKMGYILRVNLRELESFNRVGWNELSYLQKIGENNRQDNRKFIRRRKDNDELKLRTIQQR